MEHLAENGLALATLTLMEIVLGIDNIVFIAIITGKLPEPQRPAARRVGLFLAMFIRIALLLAISWVMSLTRPLFEVMGKEFTGKDLVLLLGGAFLIYKATTEIHHKLEGGGPEEAAKAGGLTFKSAVTQIVMLDIVFSRDSGITAGGAPGRYRCRSGFHGVTRVSAWPVSSCSVPGPARFRTVVPAGRSVRVYA